MQSNKLFTHKKYYLYYIKRYRSLGKQWTQSSKKTNPTQYAINYFDDFYGSVFGEKKWKNMKTALFASHKYVAIVNNFGDVDETQKYLSTLGAHNMRRLFEAQLEFNKNTIKTEDTSKDKKQVDYVQSFSQQLSSTEIENTYGNKESVVLPEKIDIGTTTIGDNDDDEKPSQDSQLSPIFLKSLQSSLNEPEYDESRIVMPNAGNNAASFWSFVPTTRLKGCEDWLPESDHFKYYSSAKDFPLTIEEENDFEFPENLQVYSFVSGVKSNFPAPRKGSTGVYNYYLMDGSSILPVLALGIKPGDKVLDLCAAPGGKSLAILQTLLCDILIANDSSMSRVNRIKKVFNEYLYDFEENPKWTERIKLSNVDGRMFNEKNYYDKVLVDVPCTTDRLSLKENDNNIFKTSRMKERLRIPEIQSELLSHALSLCKVGGTVVYSTCTLSPIQNDGVVHMGLKKAWEDHRVRATIKILTKAFEPALSLYHFGTHRAAPKYGQLVTPTLYSNFGPSYFAKIVRTKS